MPPITHNPFMGTQLLWTRSQLLAVFRLYCHTPFGKLHKNNLDIVHLARKIGRTPSAVSMKAVNFASLDPVQQARHIAGLGNASNADKKLWRDFVANPEAVAADAEAKYAEMNDEGASLSEMEIFLPHGPTEIARVVRARRVQAFFRAAVLASYDYRCALSEIAVPELLNASHIVPWKISVERRADPSNGLALNALFDRAFDRGLITFDENYRTVLSSKLRSVDPPILHRQAFLEIEGRKLRLPSRFAPDPKALRYHRENVFV
jgi:putative restriction endonuclease